MLSLKLGDREQEEKKLGDFSKLKLKKYNTFCGKWKFLSWPVVGKGTIQQAGGRVSGISVG